jgi:ubiquinone/menaquinone biosynthesis C-methylase UbiE
MAHGHDVDRFNRWATTYDRHWMQRIIFNPIQRTVLQMAEEQVRHPAAILDVGCGTGKLLKSARGRFPEARLVGVDAAKEMLKYAQSSTPDGTIEFRHATAEDLPFPNGSFDLVFSTMTFHHWQNQARGAGEVARVLTPGGRWLLADFVASGFVKPVRALLKLHQFPDRNHLRSMLPEAGLKVVKEQRISRLGGQVAVIVIERA